MSLAAARRALLLAVALPALAADTTRRVTVPQHGELEIALPAVWRYSTEESPTPPPKADKVPPQQGDTLRLEPERGTKFLLMATPAWVPRQDRDAMQATGWMKARILNQTVEGDPPIQVFKGSRNTVYWFRATNKNPNPGEHDRMVQGAAVVGELLVGFTMLYHPGDLPERDVVLKALGDARHVGPMQ
jgi:hypothetical protein